MKDIHILIKNQEQFLELSDIANLKCAVPSPEFFEEVEEKGGLWIRLKNMGNGVCKKQFIYWGQNKKPEPEKGYYLWEDIC